MWRLPVSAFLFLAVEVAEIPAWTTPALNPTVSPGQVIENIGEVVRREFYDQDALAEFNAAEARFRHPDLSGTAVSDAVTGWLATLRASHTGRYTPDQIDYYELIDIFARAVGSDTLKRLFPPEGAVTYPGIGIVPRDIGGKLFVADVYDGSPAAEAGVKVGDEVLGVDGEPLAEIASFEGKVGERVTLQLRRSAGGPPISLSIPVQAIRPGEMLKKAIRSSVRVVERDGARIGYVRLWSFANPGVEELLEELLTSEPLKSADGLVLDMRGRWGGAPPDAAEVFIGGTPPMTLIGRDGQERAANVRWRKPLVGIVDAGSRSGMEILAYSLQRAGVSLVGSKTAGAVLAGRAFMLRDDSLLLLAVMDVRVDGARLEGQGVSPSIDVPYDVRYAAGADPQLDRAVAEMSRLLAG
jgi:carboxyl-terminal processing protease